MARKIIIDTDPGVDDAMAIFFALNSPEFDVIGMTTIFGNAATDLCTTNALRLLEVAGRTDIPVARGAQRPLAMPYRGPADFVHGADGQGNANLPAPSTRMIDKHAAQFLIDEVMAAPGEITIVALGPLTNLALALLLEPAIADNVREVVLMGGNAFVPGNASPMAEANILNDPEGADVVFGAPWAVTMIGLDVTEKVYMTADDLDRLMAIPNAYGQHLAKIVPFYHQFFTDRRGEPGIHVHDSTTISYMLEPSAFKTVHYPIRVETQGISRGKTCPALRLADVESPWAGRRDVTIVVDVDTRRVIELEHARLSGAS